MSEKTFDQWCIVEIMGFSKIAGRVTEETIAGTAFIRVDVPETDNNPAYTKYFGGSSIYAITPVSEEIARLALSQMRSEPIQIYIPSALQLTEPEEEDIID
jgi:hypothetical protein